MKLSLYQRLSLSLLLVFIILISVLYYWSSNVAQSARNQSQQQLHLSLAANLARDNPLLQKGVYDHKALKNLFHTLMILGPAFEFYFLDQEGKILTHSIPESLVTREFVNLEPLLDLTQNRKALPLYGDDPRDNLRKKVFSAAPVFNGAKLQGYLYVIVAGEQFESTFNQNTQNKRMKMSMVLIISCISFLFIVTLGLFAYFTRPLRQLSKEMHLLRKVNFDPSKVKVKQWCSKCSNEVERLGATFHELVTQVNHQFKQLEQVDKQRRELLADISHDLRTPLASLQGYIETLSINIENMPIEQRQLFIDTAHKSAQQLKTLIDQIFELAHLEGGQVSINMERFNLAELLYDVIAKFSLKAEQKQLTLKVSPEFSNIMVYSDIAKLERILSNLIENAIRHTSAKGAIELQIDDIDHHQCKVSVCDNGSGIKADELAYIFDTRYRASNATQSDGKHTGLGLAITKKLLELLKSEIKVTSKIKQGTRFSFNLRKVDIKD